MITIQVEEYGNLGKVNVAYIKTDNGREACLLYDPNSNPMVPFATADALRVYAETVEAELNALPAPEAIIADASTVQVLKWRSDLFWRRFTPEERVAMLTAAKNDPVLEDFRMTLMMSPVIVSDDAELIKGMAYIVSLGIITEERKQHILADF